MLTKDFYGKNGFVWWTGVVENSDDPLKLGSVQVRIIGLHSEDKSKVPTSELPWAQVTNSPNTSFTTSVPRPGDWVFGFFQDGDYAQIPVVIGVFPGIESVQSATVYSDTVIRKGSRNVPRPSQVDRVVGEPTTVRMSRGILEGTLTQQTNLDLSHACDVKESITAAVTWAKLQNSTVVQGLNTVIRELAQSLGSDPTGLVNSAINFLKKINSFLRWINEILKDAQKFLNEVNRYVQLVRAIIDYIASIPERLRVFLRDCLAKVVGGIYAVISSLFSTSGIESLGDFGGLSTELNNTLQSLSATGTQFVRTVALPGQFIESLVTPSSSQDQENAGRVLTRTIDNLTTNGEAINRQTTFNRSNVKTP